MIGKGFPANNNDTGLKLAVFDVDVTPPEGYKMPYGTVMGTWDLGLRAKGIVLTGAGQPIVLLCIDWLGIDSECHDELKLVLASAAETTPERTAVHVIHQHDAPWGCLNDDFVQTVIHRLEAAVTKSLKNAVSVTHIGLGEAQVHQVASSRRPLGKDGKLIASRYSHCPDSALRAEPEGLVDPVLSVVSFWNENRPVTVLSYYATHPQSYYRMGIPNPDFPGIARFYRQLAVPDALHIHFTGAAGNIGAGKYNDGSHENRGILAERLADGMKRAWEKSKRLPVTTSDVRWSAEPVLLPLDSAKTYNSILWKRFKAGKLIDLQCLSIKNDARILFMPGELFIEYQLAAKKMRPDLFVAMAAYGDIGPGYIPTASAFQEGGYEVSVSNLLPKAEAILLNAIEKLLVAQP